MSEFVEQLVEQLRDPVAGELEARAGLQKNQVEDALRTLGPVVLGGMQRKRAAMEEGEFDHLVDQLGGHEMALDNMGPTVSHVIESEGADLSAGGVLAPEEGERVASLLSGKLGTSMEVGRKLIPMLAPLIIGLLMRQGKQDRSTPTQSGGVRGILDRDGDGKILDDLAGMALRELGGGGRGGSWWQRLLAMFFGRR
ncbi:MAG: DUF937 domain-containing protein [Verrucomicrobiales bacterium]